MGTENAEKQSTYGEFIDLIEQTECVEGKIFIEKWKALATEEDWARFRPMSLTPELVTSFAEDMISYFRERIAGICTDELYTQVKREAHAFLQEVHEKAAQFGVQVELNRIDVPLTPSEVAVTGD